LSQVLEISADLVRHLEGVQRRIGGEETVIVGRGFRKRKSRRSPQIRT